MIITVLCKIVDNFGDIGVCWRMCNQLKKIDNSLQINLIVDDLDSFNKINSSVKTDLIYQEIDSVSIYKWNADSYCHEKFLENDGEKLSVILECFQCGRPEWMEKILFVDKLNRDVNIIMIDYLTAEKYAEDFHCLDSLTRSKKVKKVNFMPGFTEKTGGLIIDEKWCSLKPRNKLGPILVFTYERNWDCLCNILKNCEKEIMVAQGRGLQSFCTSWEKNESNKKLNILSYLNQNQWDDLMQECSTLIIRGEESMSRACLSGIPFIWQAYPQTDEYQLVKVNALLERMKRHFSDEHYEIIKNAWNYINQPYSKENDLLLEQSVNKFISNVDILEKGYKDFALSLEKNGDLCSNLMTFIKKITIIE